MFERFDTIVCDYPLPEPDDQDREFRTRDLEGTLSRFTITRAGSLIRHAERSRFGPRPVYDIEWPIDAEIRMMSEEPAAECAVRFAMGRVQWVRRVMVQAGGGTEARSPIPGPVPDVVGRALTVEEFAAYTPRKLELSGGRVPGDEELVLLLLTSLGLRRVPDMVGHEVWRRAVEPNP